MEMTNMPRATSRRAVNGASMRNMPLNAPRPKPSPLREERAWVPPFADGPHFDFVRRGDHRLEQRCRRVEGGQAGNAALDGSAADLKPVFEHRGAIAAILVDVRHRVDHELNLTAHDHVDDGRALFADLDYHSRRERGPAMSSRDATSPVAQPRSASFSPSMTRVASLTTGTPVTLDRKGTVREARGLTSSTYTCPRCTTYWTLTRPRNRRWRAIRTVEWTVGWRW